MSGDERARLVSVRLDEASLAPATPEHEHERAIAIYDLLQRNSFAVVGHDGGPYALTLSERDGKLALSIAEAEKAAENGGETLLHVLSLSPLRRVMRDYFLVCESYYAAIRTASPSQIEAIDMGRRGLHDEAAAIVRERLDGKIAIDFETARQLFTLICALRARG